MAEVIKSHIACIPPKPQTLLAVGVYAHSQPSRQAYHNEDRLRRLQIEVPKHFPIAELEFIHQIIIEMLFRELSPEIWGEP